MDYQEMIDTLLDRLVTMNNLYGIGRITGITCGLSAQDGYVLTQKQYGTGKYAFHVKGNTLYYRGHQSNLSKAYRY